MGETVAVEEKKGISGTVLKIIAVSAMIIDHIGAIFLTDYLNMRIPDTLTQEQYTELFTAAPGLVSLNFLLGVLRLVGRFGFPLFAFLLVEGFEHTRSLRKYAFNLLVFALISELPFNLGFSGILFFPGYQNVFFTLFLGLMCITFTRFFTRTAKNNSAFKPLFYVSAFLAGPVVTYMLLNDSWIGSLINMILLKITVTMPVLFIIMGASGLVTLLVFMLIGAKWDTVKKNGFTGVILPLFVFGLIAELLMTDYSAGGVLTILVIYLFRRQKMKAFAMGCLVLFLMNFTEVTAFLMLIPIGKYNGTRGMKINKYLFYAIYPIHIGLIYLLTLIMGYTTFAIR